MAAGVAELAPVLGKWGEELCSGERGLLATCFQKREVRFLEATGNDMIKCHEAVLTFRDQENKS